MSRPKTHYSMISKNHFTGDRLKVELIDLPFSPPTHRFRVRVNGPASANCFGVAGSGHVNFR